MKSRMLMVCGLVLLAGVGQAWAHHSFSATYDAAQKVEIEGVVKEFVWRNPHSFLRVDVTDKAGRHEDVGAGVGLDGAAGAGEDDADDAEAGRQADHHGTAVAGRERRRAAAAAADGEACERWLVLVGSR
jgi:hypothetical protein